MAVGTLSGTTYTPGTSKGVADNISSGLTAPFTMDANSAADKTTVAYTAVVYGLIGFFLAKVMD